MRRLMAAQAALVLQVAVAALASDVTPLSGRAVVPAGPIVPRFNNEPIHHVARAATPPTIDGKADEWAAVPAMVLAEKSQSGGAWNGADDLSGELRLLWDDQALYFCLQVRDDVHSAPRGDKAWWENDCTQFAFDAYLNGPTGGYDPDEHSYAVSDSPGGPALVSYRTPGTGFEQEKRVEGQAVAMQVCAGGLRVYEWSMPWQQLAPVSPWLLGRCGFSFTLNDNDGRGFKSALYWTRGIIWGQDASRLGQLVFDGAQGTRPAMLALRPDNHIHPDQPSRWLEVKGTNSHRTARLLVWTTAPQALRATLAVHRTGQEELVAAGSIDANVAGQQLSAFEWDVSQLPNDRYELRYDVNTATAPALKRLEYYQLDVSRLRARSAQLRQDYGIDRPWDSLAEAPPLVRRHRGMVATALQLLEPSPWEEAMSNRDSQQELLAALNDAATMVEALHRGEDYLAQRRGVCWCAYYSPADGSGQSFVLSLPPDFDPGQTYPLVVTLHGAGGVPTPQQGGGQRGDQKHIEVLPWGRGINGYEALGETDVLRVIDYMKAWYRIDESRIYLTGASMGGRGTWRIASRHPHLFAAAAPICGYAQGLPLENLGSVPLLNQHGGMDWTVPIDQSRLGVSRLLQLGYPVLHREIPEAGHGITGLYPVRDWMLEYRLVTRPTQVVFTCRLPEPPQNRAYWLTVDELGDPHLPARISAQVIGHGPQQGLALRADNVGRLTLDLTQAPVDRQQQLLLQLGYDFLPQPAPLPERLHLVRQADQWKLDGGPAPAGDVRPYRAGAAAGLYRGEPLLIAYGSAGAAERVEMLRKAAVDLSRWPGSGRTMPMGAFPVKPDTDVTDADLDHYNLILLGGLRDSPLARRILAKLPLTTSDQGMLQAGDRSPVSLAGAGLRLAHCNPLAPKRLVFLVMTEETGKDAVQWYGKVRKLMTGSDEDDLGDAPDLVVQSLTGGDRRRMQFTHDWRWRAVEGAQTPLDAAMATAAAWNVAVAQAMRQTGGADFGLMWEGSSELWGDPQWFTLADARLTRAPSETLLAQMTGEELRDVMQRWALKNELIIWPKATMDAVEPARTYRLAMPPDLCWKLKGRQRNLQNVVAGPSCRAQDVLNLLFPSASAPQGATP